MFPPVLSTSLHAGAVLLLAWIAATAWKRPQLLRLAALALSRRRGFTAVLGCTVLACVLALLAMGGYFLHSFWGLSESTIHGETGHFRIQKRGVGLHARGDDWGRKLTYPDRVRSILASDSFLRARIDLATPELSFTGLVSDGRRTRTFLGRAVDPVADRHMSAFGEKVVAGSRLRPGDSSGALLGAGLARSLDARPGTGLTLLSTNARGGMASADLETRGATESFSRDYDDAILKMPLDAAWRMFGDSSCDRVTVLLRDTRDLDTVLARSRSVCHAAGLDVEFLRWEELATYYRSVRSLYTGIFGFFTAVLLVFSLLFVSCILHLSLLGRRSEIALLRSFGAPPGALRTRLMAESVVMALGGTTFSVAVSLTLVALFNALGVEAPAPPGSSHGYVVLLRVFQEPWFVLQVAEFVACTFVASSIAPVFACTRQPLLESLRNA